MNNTDLGSGEGSREMLTTQYFLYIGIKFAEYRLLKFGIDIMQKNPGFTLMELMVVIAIISILSALAVPNFIKLRPKRQLSAATNEILSVMQYARSRALKENTRVGLLFNTANETYKVFFDNGAGANASNGTQDGDEPTVKSGRMPPGINLKDTTLAADEVFFDSRGLLSNAGGVVNLENSLNVTKSIRIIRTGNSRIP